MKKLILILMLAFAVTAGAQPWRPKRYSADGYLNDLLYHRNDLDSYFGFDAADAWTLVLGGVQIADADNTGFTFLEIGHASDTTITRSAAGKVAVEGNDAYVQTGNTYTNVIDPNWTPMLAGENTATAAQRRTWKQDVRLDHVFDVRDYGADPTGVSDSTTAFEAARDAAIAAGGGTVSIPTGDYIVDNLEIDDTCSGINFKGFGGVNNTYTGSRLLTPADATSADYIFKFSSPSAFNVHFMDMVLTSQNGARVIYDIGTGTKTIRCDIMAGGDEAYYQDSGSDSADAGGIYDCRFYSAGATIEISGNFTIQGCYFNGNGSYHGVTANMFQSLTIRNCNFETNLRPAINVPTNTNANRNLNIIENRITCGYETGVDVIYIRECDGVRIVGNQFHTAQGGTPDSDIFLHGDVQGSIEIVGNYNTYGIELSLENNPSTTSFLVMDRAGSIKYNGLTSLTGVVKMGGGQRIIYGLSAAPAAGTWSADDIAVNADPNAGEPVAWVCTSSGTQGTWNEASEIKDSSGYYMPLSINSTTNPFLYLRSSNVVHGVTGVAPTDVFGAFTILNTARGGLLIDGLSDQTSADSETLHLRATSNDNHTDTVPLIKFTGRRRSGSSTQALENSDTVAQFLNHTTALLSLSGQGDLMLNTITNPTANGGGAIVGGIIDANNMTVGADTGAVYFDNRTAKAEVFAMGEDDNRTLLTDARSQIGSRMYYWTIDVDDDASSDNYQFDDDAANQTEQVITISNAIPAYSSLIECQLVCLETVTGSTAMSIDVGTSSGGGEILSAANTDSDGDLNTPAAGTSPSVAASTSAQSIYVNATPGANWNTLDAGRWALIARVSSTAILLDIEGL